MDFQQMGKELDRLFPPAWAESWDNIGWMVRPSDDVVSGVVVTVDVTSDVIVHARERGYNTIISHHPLLFEPLEQVRDDRPVDRCVMKAIRDDVGIYAAHTNADSMPGGLNDRFANRLGLSETEPIDPSVEDESGGLGRIGNLTQPLTVEEIADRVRDRFDVHFLRAVGPRDRTVETVGVCTGSGGDFINPSLAERVDLYISADLGHHDVLEARGLDLPLLNLDHYEMETIFLPLARELIEESIERDLSVEEYRRDDPYWH